MSILRDYQRAALDAFWAALSPDVNRVAISMATGLGKTITFAAAIDDWLDQCQIRGDRKPGGQRALVLVHTDELVRQAVEKIQVVTKGRWTIGVVKAGTNQVDADIVVASKATLDQPGRREQIRDVGFIVVDECHHAVAPSYVSILEHYGAILDRPAMGNCSAPEVCVNRLCRTHAVAVTVLGVSATLSRTDGRGLGSVWQDMPFSRSLTWGQRKGFLIPLEPYTITIPGLDPGAGDAALDTQLAGSVAPEAVVDAWMDKAWRRVANHRRLFKPSTVLFAPLVKSAQAFADAFSAEGIKAEVVHGKQAPAERKAVLDRYEAGVTTVVCNAMALTEGWDSPRTMCVIVARPTQSVPLFVQMVGRGLRPWLDVSAPPREEQRCVLLCVQGTATELAPGADLSENTGNTLTGESLLAMEDEWDIGRDIQDEPEVWTGPVRVERWDAAVQASSKAWQYTIGGVPFLPTAKRGEGYVFITEQPEEGVHRHGWKVWIRRPAEPGEGRGAYRVTMTATAPDLELAMALAEDVAQDLGGDIGALLADKTRAWRKDVPSQAMQDEARRLGLERELAKILGQRAAGKAGKLSDRISIVKASKVLDRVAEKIKERGSKS